MIGIKIRSRYYEGHIGCPNKGVFRGCYRQIHVLRKCEG
ncbi:hypothetical protein SAMN05216404_11271 [Nitrosospira multiformis]|uniref:Uncharacterized protein n=1 Tax=Nitrosospira multiformis TaxID=1231 RepID=A0A1H8MB53_9PROT|nr:hypothetical protein SAMN05216404_11271 [Nitrosospira multiformis]